jgi:DNA-binding CsgD family transcriptional regulator
LEGVVLPCHSTRPPSTAGGNAFAQVDGPVLCLPPLGTVLRQSPGEAPVHPTDPLVASLQVQRRLGPDEVTELVDAYRQGVPVEELAASFQINRTTVLGHVRRHGVPKRNRRALRPDDVDRAAKLYSEGCSAEWVADELEVAASTVRRALKDAGVVLRPSGRQRRGSNATQ